MASDPYTYPGTETLRNRLGITDDKTLTEAERRLTQARGAEAARLTFPATADGYRALHRHLFQDLYDWAGQDRSVNIAKGGSSFAAVPYLARELDNRFAEVGAQSGLRGLPRDEFFDRLGNHINEINAIHPFREGNGRTMRHHAAQLAREAGHPIRIAAIDKDRWMEASRHGFLTGDHRGMAAVLSAAAVKRDLAPEARASAFYRAWAMKEAYLKAWGTGLSFASNRFTLDYVGDGAGRLVSTDMPGDDPDEWRFEDVPLGGGYTGAICFEGVKRRLRRWTA